MRKPNKEIQLTTYQDLLGVDENMGANTEKVVIAPLTEIPYLSVMWWCFIRTERICKKQ